MFAKMSELVSETLFGLHNCIKLNVTDATLLYVLPLLKKKNILPYYESLHLDAKHYRVMSTK